MLNLSNTSVEFVQNLSFTNKNLKVEELDLSFNNLTSLRKNFLASLIKLKRLNLRETFLINFDFIKLLVNLQDLDLTNSQNLIMDPNFSFKSFSASEIKRLEFSYSNLDRMPTQNLAFSLLTIQSLTIEGNDLIYFNEVFLTIEYLDLSQNSFSFMLNIEPEITIFRDLYTKMKFINLTKSLKPELENKTFFFNKKLEYAFLSQNGLKIWPKFCQFCLERDCSDGLINIECQLKILDFSSNKLEYIHYNGLLDMNNLEYLNLENNNISSIQTNAFSNLIKLEILLLSFNNIASFDSDTNVFNYLTSLKQLSLKSNKIEYVPSFLFKNLRKLETIDLSSNRICLLEKFSFYNLVYLRNLYLEKNKNRIQMENESFSQINKIQNIFLSKSILDDEINRIVLINLFEIKKSQIKEDEKKVLNVTYFKSLFLMFDYDVYDCNLTLYFMRKNIHLNFKYESHIHDYFEMCSLTKVKNSTQTINEEYEVNEDIRFLKIFSNYVFWFFILTLLFILIMSIICCINITTTSKLRTWKYENAKKGVNILFIKQKRILRKKI